MPEFTAFQKKGGKNLIAIQVRKRSEWSTYAEQGISFHFRKASSYSSNLKAYTARKKAFSCIKISFGFVFRNARVAGPFFFYIYVVTTITNDWTIKAVSSII